MITLNKRLIFSRSSEDIIFNGIIPPGATTHNDNDAGGSPVSWDTGYTYDGIFVHVSDYMGVAIHQHYFDGATSPLNKGPINSSHYIHQYLFINNIVSTNYSNELMMQVHDGGSWDYRAYWGANMIHWGTDGTVSRRYMGTLPIPGRWIRLSISLDYIGMTNKNIHGLAFSCYNMGRLYWGPTYINSASRLPETENKKYFIFSDFNATTAVSETIRLLSLESGEQVTFNDIDLVKPSALGTEHANNKFLAGDGTWKSVGNLAGSVGTILNKYNYGGL